MSIRRLSPRPRVRLIILAVILLSLVLLSGFGCSLGCASCTVGGCSIGAIDTGSTGSSEAFVQQEGEVFLEPAGKAGPDSFAGEVFTPTGPTSTLSIPTSTTQTPTTQAPTTSAANGAVQVASYPGDTPALYGGSKSKTLVDKEGQLRFLDENPNKAAAFCAALNSDPTLRWSGGNQVRPDQLSDYFAELTPMMLTRDIRVTNHGYRNGKPTPRQSVLQAGQLVLVDRYGVPRVRCECGNPLIPPKPVKTKPRYTGPQWPGFDPTTIIVIQQTTVIIDIFVVVDVQTGLPFDRPAGTTGAQDVSHGEGSTTTVPSSSTTVSTAGPTGQDVEQTELPGTWRGTLTFTDITLDAEAAQTAGEQGCSPAVLEALKGRPLPMQMDITVDGSGGGTAVMFLDMSSLLEGGGSVDNEPQTMSFTYAGNTLTFEMNDSQGASSMTGTVSRQGGDLVIEGTIGSSDSGSSMEGVWSIAKD